MTDLDSARTFLQSYADKAAADTGRLWGIWLGGELVGGVLFRVMDPAHGTAEAGCWLEPSAVGRGLVTRASRAIIDWAVFERGIHRVEWVVSAANEPSIAVARRLGMQRDGVLRESYPHRGRRVDMEVWSVLAPEWRAIRSPEDAKPTGSNNPPSDIPPDDKDWTGVITTPCAECGFDPADISPSDIGPRLRAAAQRWPAVLARPDAADRPSPTVWSAVEYGAHVRDASQIFRERLELMLRADDPEFENWDQDQTAIERRYWTQRADTVAAEYAEQAEAVAAAFEGVTPDQVERTGRRSNGSRFTVATLGVYFLHDIEHHLHDVHG